MAKQGQEKFEFGFTLGQGFIFSDFESLAPLKGTIARKKVKGGRLGWHCLSGAKVDEKM
ncbi:MAG: hypothetical protein Sapg2KO_52330 [Saprospiraceae bacterium]